MQARVAPQKANYVEFDFQCGRGHPYCIRKSCSTHVVARLGIDQRKGI